MAKNSKKKKRKSSQLPAPFDAVKESAKTFPWKKAILLLVLTVVVFAAYLFFLRLEEIEFAKTHLITPYTTGFFSITTLVYYSVAALLLLAIFILNRGFTKGAFTPELFPVESYPNRDEVDVICARVNKQKAIAKKLMLILIPFLVTIFLDLIDLFYGDLFEKLISSFSGTIL